MAKRRYLPVDQLLQIGLMMMLATFLMALREPLRDHTVNPGDSAPEFSLMADGGVQVTTRNFGGRALLLNFWATWCEPCREEFPSLKALARTLGPEGLVVLGVSSDYNAKAYNAFIRNKPASFLTVRLPDESLQAQYGTVKIPETYLIDRRGKVQAKFISNQDWTSQEIVATVRSLL